MRLREAVCEAKPMTSDNHEIACHSKHKACHAERQAVQCELLWQSYHLHRNLLRCQIDLPRAHGNFGDSILLKHATTNMEAPNKGQRAVKIISL